MPPTSGRRRARREPEATQTDTNDVATGATGRKRREVVQPSAPGRALRPSTMAQRPTEVSSRPPEMPSLCFYDAAVRLKENTITEDEYLQAIVAHCTGIRHGKNQLCNGDTSDIPHDGNANTRFHTNWKRFFASNVLKVDYFAWKVARFIIYYVDEEEMDNPAHGRDSELRFTLFLIS